MVTECQITLKLLKTFDPFQATGFSQYVLKTPGFLTFTGWGMGRDQWYEMGSC